MAVSINGYTMTDEDLRRRQEMLDRTGDVVRPGNRAQQLREQNIRGGFGSTQRRQQLLDQDAAARTAREQAAAQANAERMKRIEGATSMATEDRRAQGLAQVAQIEGQSAVTQQRMKSLEAIRLEQERARTAPKFQIVPPGSALVDPVSGDMKTQVPFKQEPTVTPMLTPAIDTATGEAIPGVYMTPDGRVVRQPTQGGGMDPRGGMAAPGAATTTPTAPKQPLRRKTADGRMALYDPDTKAFLRYE